MYKEIFTSLAKDSNLYYKIKNKEEAEWFANELLNHGYSDDKDKFVELFEGGRDCLIVYKGYTYKDYALVYEDTTLATGRVKYEPSKTVVNPTYDDLKHLFIDEEPPSLFVEFDLEEVDVENIGTTEYDTVERPKHYNVFEKEVIYTIKDLLDNNNNYKGFDNYCIGNSLKYIFRAGLKGDYYEDLEKARYYINKILEGKES